MAERCEIVCEIRYGGELTFEGVAEAESVLRQAAEDLLAEFDPAYLDFHPLGDELSFTGSLRSCDGPDLAGLCGALAQSMDPGATGRLVCVEAGFGPVRVFYFGKRGVSEDIVPGRS